MTPAQEEWLARFADRVAISDLLLDFARCLDERDWEGYASNFAEDGVLELPWKRVRQAELAGYVSANLSRYQGTLHYSTNHVIEIEGDTARSRSYLLAVHLLDGSDPSRHADAGGWYDCEYRRTPDGWRFTRVRVSIAWTGGEPLTLPEDT